MREREEKKNGELHVDDYCRAWEPHESPTPRWLRRPQLLLPLQSPFLSLSKSNSKFNISLINFSFLISSIFFFSVVIVEMREMRRTEPEGNLRRPKRHRSSPRWEGHHSSHSKGDLKCPLRFIKLFFFFFFNFSIQSMRRFIIVSERLWLPHKSL